MAATARRPRSRGWTGARPLTRIVAVLLLLVPVGLLFVTSRQQAIDEQNRAAKELLGVDYLRALQPLTVALLAAQSEAVAGRSVNTAAMTQAFASMDAADAREGDTLGLRDRWQGLRAKIQGLPPQGQPRAMYTAYAETADLMVALYGRVRQASGLAADPWADAVSLQRVVAVDLPAVNVAFGRYADLTQAGVGNDLPASALAEVLAQREAVGEPGRDLVDSLQAAVDSTTSVSLSGDILAEVDGMRRSLDALTNAPVPTGTYLAATDASAANTLRANAAAASAALSGKVLDALAGLLGERHDAAGRDLLRANLTLGAAAVLAVLLLVLEAIGWPRRREEPPGQHQPVSGRREMVGAAR
jgi:hypothetical protein